MFFRKPGLPILMVRLPDGTEKPYWNTFYQEVRYPRPDAQDLMAAAGLQYATRGRRWRSGSRPRLDAGRTPGARSTSPASSATRPPSSNCWSRAASTSARWTSTSSRPLVWEFYADTLDKLAGYGAQIVRLDAFAYAPKEPGEKNFLNDPGTWDLLDRVKAPGRPARAEAAARDPLQLRGEDPRD